VEGVGLIPESVCFQLSTIPTLAFESRENAAIMSKRQGSVKMNITKPMKCELPILGEAHYISNRGAGQAPRSPSGGLGT